MNLLKKIRQKKGLSQRALAHQAGLAYKTLQLLESGSHDPRLSTLQDVAGALGYPNSWVQDQIQNLWELSPDSVAITSHQIFRQGEKSWKLWLFNFVDAFRFAEDKETLVRTPPSSRLDPKIKALFASTVEALCEEVGMQLPDWCPGISALPTPWFVSELENLKAMALVEGSVFFRKRNIFVLENFLERL